MQSSPSATDPLDPGPKGFAHRGLHDGAAIPENSLAGFERALRFGAGIECDLRLTSDDRIVVFHDPDGERLCGSRLRIGRSKLSDIRRLSVNGQAIPTLEELLDLVRGRVPLLLEMKTERDASRWPAAVDAALTAYRGPFGVMSFDPLVVRRVKARLPRVRRGLVIGAGLSSFRRKLALSLATPHFIAVDRAALDELWVAAARPFMPVYTWTIRTPEQRTQALVQADALIWEADGRP